MEGGRAGGREGSRGRGGAEGGQDMERRGLCVLAPLPLAGHWQPK